MQFVAQPSAAPAAGQRRAGTRANAVGSVGGASVTSAAAAIKRSPLNLDLPDNHPGLALVAQSLVR
jgi:hypothetical protein